jgi:hypothetical protein
VGLRIPKATTKVNLPFPNKRMKNKVFAPEGYLQETIDRVNEPSVEPDHSTLFFEPSINVFLND